MTIVFDDLPYLVTPFAATESTRLVGNLTKNGESPEIGSLAHGQKAHAKVPSNTLSDKPHAPRRTRPDTPSKLQNDHIIRGYTSQC